MAGFKSANMHLMYITPLLLAIHFSLGASNSTTTPEPEEETIFFNTLAPNSSVESKLPPMQEIHENVPHIFTTPETTSWTTNSMDLAPNDATSPSNSTSAANSTDKTKPLPETPLPTETYKSSTSTRPEPTTQTQSSSSDSPSTSPSIASTTGRESTTTDSALARTDDTSPTFTPTFLSDVMSEGTTLPTEEPLEHNAIQTEDPTAVTTEKEVSIVVGRRCTRLFQDSVLWNETDGGMLALKSCPSGYQGNMYRPCFSNGKWGNVDYSECRLERLGRMRHMIIHQVQKGMLGNMYILADEFSKYISSVDMKSPMDRLEAFEILNIFLKLDMNLKMDKTRDIKYIQTLLHSCNELIKKKTVLFSPGSQENKLITEKAVEMVFDLTHFAQRCLRSLLKTQRKQMPFRSSPNVVLYLYRGKLSGKFTLLNFSSERDREDEISSIFNLEKTLERSAYALIWIKGLRGLLSTSDLIVNSDVAVATILSPLNSLNHMAHPPTFDIGLRMEKAQVEGYTLKCGQLWNMSQLWNTKDCSKANVKGDIITCRCHHLGSIALLLEEETDSSSMSPVQPIGRMIRMSCAISFVLTALTLAVNFVLKRGDQHLSVFIFINIIVCIIAIELILLFGVNKTAETELCLSFAMLLHYLFLVLCCWVLGYSLNLFKRLRSNMEYCGRPRDYCACCWVTPGILLIVAFILNPHGYETTLYCWMNIRRGIFWSFVFPITGLILINTIIMILALKTFNDQMSIMHRTEICKTRNSLRTGIALLPYFAINWLFGILAVEYSYNSNFQFAFFLTNSFQAVLIFFFFCVRDTNIQASFRMKVAEVSRRPKVSAMKLTKSGSFPILERSLITLTDDRRRLDSTPLLAGRTAYHDTAEDPCCSNIRV